MITYDADSRIFTLSTKNTAYQFKIYYDTYPVHLYYGAETREDMSYLAFPGVNGFEDKPERLEIDFPVQDALGETGTFGLGDNRPAQIKIRNGGGDCTTFFRYKSYSIEKGRREIPALPHSRGGESVSTLVIALFDDVSQCELKLFYVVYEDSDTICRYASVENRGSGSVELLRAMSLCLDMEGSDFEAVYLSGSWARENSLVKRRLKPGLTAISTLRGETSAQLNSFIAVGETGADENRGGVYGFNLVYSGNHCEEVYVDDFDRTRITVGINPESFQKDLKPGEIFYTPEAVMTYSAQGYGGMSRNFHDHIREHVCDSRYKSRRPMLVNTWEGTYFAIDEGKLLDYAASAKQCGIDMLVMDDGWFGVRNDDRSGLGDWYVNRDKFPGGLKSFVDKVNAIGLKFGIWIEPEMVNPDSELYRAHPDWALHVNGRARREGRNQLVLDMTRADVVDYLFNRFKEIFSSCNVEYVKWDMNRGLSEAASAGRAACEQKTIYHDYVLGVYKLYGLLQAEFPDIYFENCSSGGGRFDMGMLYYSPQIWTSDNTDPFMRPFIQYGCSYAYPLSAVSAHISESPNSCTWLKTSLEYRFAVSIGGVLGYELNTSHLSDEEKAEVKRQIERYREIEPLILNGDLYRLVNPFETGDSAAQIIVSKDKKSAVAVYLKMNGTPHSGDTILKLNGLAADKFYRDKDSGCIYKGSSLMNAGIRFNLGSAAAQSKIFVFQEV